MVLLFRRRTLPPIPGWTRSKAAEVLFVRDSERLVAGIENAVVAGSDHFGWSLEGPSSKRNCLLCRRTKSPPMALRRLQTASPSGLFQLAQRRAWCCFPSSIVCSARVAPHIEGIPARSVADVVEENKRVTRCDQPRQTGEVQPGRRGARRTTAGPHPLLRVGWGWHLGKNLAFTLSEGLAAVGIQVSKVILAFIRAISTLDGSFGI